MRAVKMDGHWHAATGYTGYGPDAHDEFLTATDWEDLADILRYELRAMSDTAAERAHMFANACDYRAAWEENKRSEDLSHLARNLDNTRKNAPLYRDDPDAWHATIQRIVTDRFPVAISENTSLYAWECEESECDMV